MGYLVLARKWRPQRFEDIIGQEHVSRTLMNAIRADRVAHAFLFTGVRGVGKTTAARVLAKALNCVDGPTPTPCNACVNCQEITAGNAVDVLEIDGASNTGVDDVREIIENVRYHPAKSRFKIYIIDEVHMLSTSAFNALLKTLEEPPPHVKFIFATTDPHKVPHTIHSRCQRYDFKRLPFKVIADRLGQIAASEGVEISDRARFLIAREGEGSMRDAQSLLDQVIAFAGTRVSDADVAAALGVADRKLLYDVAAALIDRQPGRALELINELHLYGYDLRRFVRELLEHVRNLSVARLLDDNEALTELPDEERAELRRQAERATTEDLDRAFLLLLEAENEISRVTYPKLVLEMVIIKIATLTPVVPINDILDSIAELQQRSGTEAPRQSAPAPTDRSAGPPPAPRREPAASFNARSTNAPTSAPVASGGDGGWTGFLEFVGKEKIMLLEFLKSSVPPAVDGAVLALAVPRGHFHDYLVQRDNTQAVEQLASRFFGRPLRVTVTPTDAAEAPAPPPSENGAALHAAALGDPTVRAAVEILGGEVQEVKSRARRGKGTS